MQNEKRAICVVVVCVMAVANFATADTFGTGSNQLTIDFVSIGNVGNLADTQVMMTDCTTGYGSVDYNYRIGTYEITNAQWNAFVAAAGVPAGDPSIAYNSSVRFTGNLQPANKISWYEAAQFCNYLTSGDKSKGAYLFSGNNANPGDFSEIDRIAAQATYGTIYVIPTENEWYKAAYYTPNTGGYSYYANSLNTIPAADIGWNYSGGAYNVPWNVGTGTQEQNGTYDMMGNIWEWNEALIGPYRGLRGGSYYTSYDGYGGGGAGINGSYLASFYRNYSTSSYGEDYVGFRVASIPEPASLLLLGLGGLILRRQCR